MRVAGRGDAHDNAAAANRRATAMAVMRSMRRERVDVERSGARMTGAEEARQEGALASTNFRAEPGSLYVVATPVGNLRDLTLRALDVLRTVDVIRAEDTRVTSVLLARYGIATRPHSLHQHNEARQIASVLDDLAAGRSVALVSDAGTPGISDPGARLVRAALDARHRVIPIPGANAAATAISAAGLQAERFLFVGFLPMQAKARRELLETVAPLPVALVIYEAPHRVAATVRELSVLLDPARSLTIARELTKTFETIVSLPLEDANAWIAGDANRERGEFVLIVDAAPAPGKDLAISAEARRLLAALLEELPPARAARVAAKVTKMPRELLYEHACRASSTRRDDA